MRLLNIILLLTTLITFNVNSTPVDSTLNKYILKLKEISTKVEQNGPIVEKRKSIKVTKYKSIIPIKIITKTNKTSTIKKEDKKESLKQPTKEKGINIFNYLVTASIVTILVFLIIKIPKIIRSQRKITENKIINTNVKEIKFNIKR